MGAPAGSVFGIRSKLLGFYAATLTVMVGLFAAGQVVASGASREFEVRLERYHAVHRLREALDAQRRSLEQRFREGPAPQAPDLDGEFRELRATFAAAAGAAEESEDAFFAVRATGRGLDAYFALTRSAAQKRAAGAKDYYQDFAQAERAAAYVDAYLAGLLSASLAAGNREYDAVAKRSEALRTLTFFAFGVFALFSALFAAALSASIATPLRRVAQASERMARGDLDVGDVEAPTGDEVEVLARSFNAMSRNLRAMVEGLKEKAELERRLREDERALMEAEKALKEAQFRSLQDQIRPHFLFNALNTIARTALFEEAPQTERLTHALGRLFRYSLGSPDGAVTVREEAAVLREYLDFQAIRFGDRLRWDIGVEASAEDALIPRFTLQPLVENAVRHGIEPLEEGGEVTVRVRKRGGRIEMSVADTGTGMDREKVKALLAHSGSGIGVANVARRLALRYGEAGVLNVRSAPGKGTVVRVSFPAKAEEEA